MSGKGSRVLSDTVLYFNFKKTHIDYIIHYVYTPLVLFIVKSVTVIDQYNFYVGVPTRKYYQTTETYHNIDDLCEVSRI